MLRRSESLVYTWLGQPQWPKRAVYCRAIVYSYIILHDTRYQFLFDKLQSRQTDRRQFFYILGIRDWGFSSVFEMSVYELTLYVTGSPEEIYLQPPRAASL